MQNNKISLLTASEILEFELQTAKKNVQIQCRKIFFVIVIPVQTPNKHNSYLYNSRPDYLTN